MTFQSLKQKFLRDLKASWRKTASLCVLLAIGFAVWIPKINSAIGGKAKPATAVKVASPPRSQPNQQSAPLGRASATKPASGKLEITWQEAEQILRTDPLVTSADVAAMRAEPFQVDRTQFSPPILFAEAQEPVKPKPKPVNTKPVKRSFENLILKSTIIGPRRRAAVINGKFYPEGSQLEFDGEMYRVHSVNPGTVTISQGEQNWTIEIAERNLFRSIQIERHRPVEQRLN